MLSRTIGFRSKHYKIIPSLIELYRDKKKSYLRDEILCRQMDSFTVINRRRMIRDLIL
jgi:hypothetical protein